MTTEPTTFYHRWTCSTPHREPTPFVGRLGDQLTGCPNCGAFRPYFERFDGPPATGATVPVTAEPVARFVIPCARCGRHLPHNRPQPAVRLCRTCSRPAGRVPAEVLT